MWVTFHICVLYDNHVSYANWYANSRTVLPCLSFRFRSFDSRMLRRETISLRNYQSISEFCTVQIYHMRPNLRGLRRWIFVRFCGIPSFASHMGRSDDHCLCKSHVVLTFRTSRTCHMLTNSWIIERCFSVSYCGLGKLLRTSFGAGIIYCESLISFLRFKLLESIGCLLTIELYVDDSSFGFVISVALVRRCIASEITYFASLISFGLLYGLNLLNAYWNLISRTCYIRLFFCPVYCWYAHGSAWIVPAM